MTIPVSWVICCLVIWAVVSTIVTLVCMGKADAHRETADKYEKLYRDALTRANEYQQLLKQNAE